MSLSNTGADGATWPMPTFTFMVTFGTALTDIPFQQVSGMDTETQIPDYRHGNSPSYENIHMPGISKIGNVTMKRGVFVNDHTFWNWYNQVKMNTVTRATITVRLLNEKNAVTMYWYLNNAWVTKISSTDLKSDGNEVAIESLEIAYEQLTMSNGK